MNRLENMSKPLVWSTALLLTAIVAGCGGSTGAAGTPGAQGNPGINGLPGASGVPGTPALGTAPGAVNLLTAASYALTTSSGLTATLGSASGVAGVTNSATYGGNVAMDAPTSTCTSTPAASAVGQDSCGLNTATADTTNAAVNIPQGLKITGTTIRYNPGVTNTAPFNTSVRAVKNDVNTAWKDAFNRLGGVLITGPGRLDGRVLPPGIYTSMSTMTLGTGQTLTLDAGAGNANAANAVWIFQVGSDMTITGSTVACTGTAPNYVCTPTQVVLLNGALARNVFWQVGTPGSAGIGSVSFPAATGPVQNNTIFKGTILAGDNVTFAGGTALEGRVLAGADLLGTPNGQTGGAVTTTGGSTGAVTVTLPL